MPIPNCKLMRAIHYHVQYMYMYVLSGEGCLCMYSTCIIPRNLVNSYFCQVIVRTHCHFKCCIHAYYKFMKIAVETADIVSCTHV